MLSGKRLKTGGIFIISTILLFVIYCAVNPVTGKRELMLLTEADEVALGQQTDQQVMAEYGLYDDPELTNYINDLGQRMAKVTHRPQLNYTFKVLDSPVINAFAVPGGYVYVTRGILGYFNNEAELAGVIGHELGHVNARHSAVQYSRAQFMQLGLGLGVILSEKFRDYAALAQFGVGMLFMRFSRDNERQADDLGVEYSMKLNYDANHMANFFDTLERMNPGSAQSGLPGWFSTHPNPVDRVKAVKNKKLEWQKKLGNDNLVVNRNEYLTHIDGITFGEDPRQGYVDGNAFYHPNMKFTFPVPPKWKLNNTPNQVQMVSEDENAVILFSLEEAETPYKAAQKFTQETQSTIQSSDAISVNGLAAHKLVSNIKSEQDNIQVMSYFIESGEQIYVFHGFTNASAFSGKSTVFSQTMSHFNKLNDPKKINVKADHVEIRTVKKQGTLKNVLKNMGGKEDNLEKLAIMNGMQLEDVVKKNSKIKMVLN